MSNIFKFYINNNNNLTYLYLFIKSKYLSGVLQEPIENLQKKYHNSKEFIISDLFNTTFKDDFSNLDIKYIEDFNITIYFVDENIYYDDTLEIIKFKFLKYYNNLVIKTNQVSYEELYIYGLINKKYNSSELYNILCNNNSNKISNEDLKQYLLNINEQIEIYNQLLEINDNKEKDYYNFEDINSIKLQEINVLTPIGQNINNKLPHLYTTNPFQVKKYSHYIRSIINTSLNTNNNNLLFEYNIVNNCLFICLFYDVINYSKQLTFFLEEDITTKLYFPLIASNQINSYEVFSKDKESFLEKTNTHTKLDLFNNKNTFINTLYYINYNSEKYPDLNYDINGINNINFNIHTNINLSLSLESLFKIINSNSIIPFIKYNPGKKHENIYRLYCNKKNKDNKKIPFLSKDLIIKFSKIIGKNNTIAMVIINDDTFIKNNTKLFTLELDIYGTMNIKIELINHINVREIDNIIKKNVNPIINIIKKYVNNDTNNISNFKSLIDSNIEVINLNYIIKIQSKFSIKLLNNIKNCLYFFFNIINDKTKEKLYRYKRVSNYNEMNDKDAFIIELIKLKETPIKIIQKLKENFKLSSDEEASNIFESAIQSLDIVQNLFNYKKLKIKDSPGFIFKIDNNINNQINISIENIDNIRYIYFIKLYIDSIFKMAFNDIKDIDLSICKSSKKKDKQFVEDIIPKDISVDLNEKNIANVLNTPVEIDLDDVIDAVHNIDEDDNSNDLLDLLLNDDEENDDEENDDEENDDQENDDEENNDEENDDQEKNDEENDDEEKNDEENNIKEKNDEENEDEEYKNKEKDHLKKNDKMKDNEELLDDDNISEDEDKLKKFKESTRGNPILNRLEKTQPGLFKVKTYKPNLAKEDSKKNFVNYSRLCQSSRQPVIINEEEKQKFISNNPTYNNKDILEYSINPNEKYYYICPKFWDLENNQTLNKEQVASGKYGTIYSKGKGNIYEFPDKDKEPAFLKDTVKDEEGNEFCLPCCFGKLKKDKTTTEDNGKRICNIKTQVIKHGDIKYIIRSDKFPLEQYKVGHLPVNIKKFLQFDSDSCINSDNNNLKYKYPCLLRYGVQNDSNCSFIACIADVYSKEILKSKTSLSIDEMRNVLVKCLTIDNFITYNNANLTQIFLNKNVTQDFLDSIDINKFDNDNKFYEKLDLSNYNQINLYKKILLSFENFKLYLKTNNYIIDYTYLWDIICKPNPLLFPNGINLIIIDITSYDLTDNVKVVCPKQNYSNEFIDNNKKSLILLMKEHYFEPIYLIKTEITDIITPLFSFTSKSSEYRLDEFKKILNFIKEDINNNCTSSNDSKIDKFEKNIALDNIINILNKLKFEVNYQVMDYENKIIAIIVSNDLYIDVNYGKYRYIPCYPSKIYEDYDIPIIFIDELKEEYFTNYNSTKDFLEKIYNSTNEIIKCKPIMKIIQDELIIGILTNANQFVMLNKPEVYINDELKELSDKNYLFTDTIIQNKLTIDKEREEMINNIKLESGFYNSFRTTIIKLLSEYKNYKFNIKIQDIIKNNSLIYFDKLKLIRDELELLSEKYITFAKYDKKILNNIKEFSLCINNSNCDTDFCMINSATNICNLIIPELNLITNESNYNIYFTKLSDEFARYNKTKLMLFNSSNLTTFNNIKYNINSDEIILMESVLAEEIKSSGLLIKDPYSNYNTFDTNNILSSSIINKINTSNINLQYNDFELDKIQSNEKIILKLPKEQIDKIKLLEKKYKKEKSEEDLPELEKDIPKAKNIYSELSIDEYTKDHKCINKKNEIKINEIDLVSSFTNKIYEFYFDISTNKLCSFELPLFILKHYYDKSNEMNLSEMSIDELKNILIEEYFNHEYTESLIKLMSKINSTFKNNQDNAMNLLMNELKTSSFLKIEKFKKLIYNVINSSNFYVTYLDYYLIAKKFNLPIILICNTIINVSITNKTFIILNKNTQNNNYYFIKVPTTFNRTIKNCKLLFMTNNISFNIDKDLQDNDKLQIQTNILSYIEKYDDLFLIKLKMDNIKYIEPKNKKLLKK